MDRFKRTAGVDILPVPYRGAAPAYSALVAGEVQVIASGLGAATPFLEAGQAKALAALSLKRPASFPNLPTIAEAGYPNFNLISWMAVFVRTGTPKDIAVKLENEILGTMESPDIREKLMKLGLEPAPLKGAEFNKFFANEIANWRAIVEATGSKQQ
jgi:tripartite-type tricarboxylate transporter receptor subunit TctC